MTTATQLRRSALSNPEAAEGVADGSPTFAVGGQEFAALDADGRVRLRLPTNAGITTLDQVAELSDAELGAMHGVGPKAVRVLREALDAR
jgi:predicted flap endonuclease-1-like 5' DNA nuclease